MTLRGAAGTRARWRPPWDPDQVKLTPAYVLEPVRVAMGGIGLDPCTEPDNPTRAREYHALPDDGLSHRWIGRGPVWVNPPWGDAAGPWITRALETGQAGEVVALLIPAYTASVRVQSVLRGADRVCFIAGRLDFGSSRPNGQPFRFSGATILAAFGFIPPAELGVTLRP
jgi:hypothetical protein